MHIPVWLKDTLERAARTFVQSFLAVAGYTGVGSGFADIKWLDSLQIAAVATVFSLLMAFAASASNIGTEGTASLVKLEPNVAPPETPDPSMPRRPGRGRARKPPTE